MTPEDRQVIYGLVFIPGKARRSSRDDVLRYFGTTDGHALGHRLLRDAVDSRDEIDVDSALIVCGTFGITADHLEAEDALMLLLNEPDETVRENAAKQLTRRNQS